jgi:hypothetical protein
VQGASSRYLIMMIVKLMMMTDTVPTRQCKRQPALMEPCFQAPLGTHRRLPGTLQDHHLHRHAPELTRRRVPGVCSRCCCLLSAAWCLLSIVCCLLPPACSLLPKFQPQSHAFSTAMERCTAGTAAGRQHSHRPPTRHGEPHHRTLPGVGRAGPCLGSTHTHTHTHIHTHTHTHTHTHAHTHRCLEQK